jgi:hypothetical protein
VILTIIPSSFHVATFHFCTRNCTCGPQYSLCIWNLVFPMFGSCDALCVQTAGCPVCADCRLPCVSGPTRYCRMAGLVYVDPRIHGLPAQPQPASDISHNHPPQISLRAFNVAGLAVLTPAAPMELSSTFKPQELEGRECLGPSVYD